jgi:divalent metal cation (Fe/Co/Zn/Cd) transporter
MSPVSATNVIERPQYLKTALWLELLTVTWMIVEAVGALAAAFLARSVLLLAFGIDSGIELLSALVLFWRLRTIQL